MLSRLCYGGRRFASSIRVRLTLTDDATTIVALHPEPKVPYEKSLPLPEIVAQESSSPLRCDVGEMRRATGMEQPLEQQDLCDLTLTTKHPWYPNKRRNRRNAWPTKTFRPERPYL